MDLIEHLTAEVSDPERVKITTDEFKLKARRKISLRQLMLLEKQKALERARITDRVNAEITMIGNCKYIHPSIHLTIWLQSFLSHFLAYYSVSASVLPSCSVMRLLDYRVFRQTNDARV